MRLAFISTMARSPWGGSEELWAAGARAALAAGHEVLISTFHWQDLPPQVAHLQQAGARLLLRPRQYTRLQKLISTLLPIFPPWLRTLRDFKPDAVLISQGSAYECVARQPTRPLLAWLTGTPAAPAYINLVQYNRPGVKRRRRTKRDASRFYQHAAANLFVCDRNITEASEWLGTAVPRAKVISNPANLTDTSALPWPPIAPGADGTIRIACVARLDNAVKGQDLLLQALAKIGDPRVHITLAGTGPDEAAIKALSASLGLEARVHFPGHVSNIRELWATHHMLALGSHSEGTPLAMIEAMLLARPVMVTDVGGCSDWVGPGHEGWIAASPTVDHIVTALQAALTAVEQWPAMGAAARAKALRLLDPHAGQTVLSMLTTCGASKR